MIKRTLYFGNPAYLSTKNKQMVLSYPNTDGMDLSGHNTLPIEDIGIVILDHQQITITQYLLALLLENNVAVITCDQKHMPTGMFLNLNGNQLQSARFKAQIQATEPLKKQLWAQTIQAKIYNQSLLLKQKGIPTDNFKRWISEVRSGDADNHEARAAANYWPKVFPELTSIFRRDPDGEPPNMLLNYGYAILRAITARSLTGSGLLPTLGIFHRNQYNAYCLADDIMEPYRPFVDRMIATIVSESQDYSDLSTVIKKQLLSIATLDAWFGKEHSPLTIAMGRTTASLSACFEGRAKKLIYPTLYEVQ